MTKLQAILKDGQNMLLECLRIIMANTETECIVILGNCSGLILFNSSLPLNRVTNGSSFMPN